MKRHEELSEEEFRRRLAEELFRRQQSALKILELMPVGRNWADDNTWPWFQDMFNDVRREARISFWLPLLLGFALLFTHSREFMILGGLAMILAGIAWPIMLIGKSVVGLLGECVRLLGLIHKLELQQKGE